MGKKKLKKKKNVMSRWEKVNIWKCNRNGNNRDQGKESIGNGAGISGAGIKAHYRDI